MDILYPYWSGYTGDCRGNTCSSVQYTKETKISPMKWESVLGLRANKLFEMDEMIII